MASIQSAAPKALLVEGNNDRHVVRHIHKKVERACEFDTLAKGNVDSVIAEIPVEIRAPGRRALGIMVDANDNLRRRWTDISRCLDGERIELPDAPAPDGTVIDGEIRVGIWLMPDNGSAGELEDFVQRMIPENDPVWPLSQRYIAGIPPGARKFPERKKAKAELYAWLATRREPGPMGRAVAARDLVVDGQLCQRFLAWTERLFR